MEVNGYLFFVHSRDEDAPYFFPLISSLYPLSFWFFWRFRFAFYYVLMHTVKAPHTHIVAQIIRNSEIARGESKCSTLVFVFVLNIKISNE